MLKDTVLQCKNEKEQFLTKNYISREKISFIERFINSEMVKIITGPRRAGKSVFCMLALKDKEFAYLNFDDEALLKIQKYDDIIKVLNEVYPNAKYMLFDEIQNLKNWEVFVNKLHRRGNNLIITGSNSSMLNRELATTLTGRYIPIDVFPFNFREFLEAKKFIVTTEKIDMHEVKGKILSYLDDYIHNGGYPEIVVKNLDTKIYIETLFDAILFKDVVRRYKIRFPQQIYDLCLYLTTNFTGEFSYTKLKNNLGLGSTSTIEKYLRYFEETYIVSILNKFSFKVKEQIKSPRKIYIIDNGFVTAKAFQFSKNTGKLMENLVFCELMRNGYKPNKDFFYYKTTNNREVNFRNKSIDKSWRGIRMQQSENYYMGI